MVDASIPPSCESETAGQDERDSEAGRGADSRVSPAESPVVNPDDDGLGLRPESWVGTVVPLASAIGLSGQARQQWRWEADGPMQSIARTARTLRSMHLSGMEAGPKPW